jgi:hypothetical protein
MRNLSSLMESTAPHGERKPMGAWAAGLFVAMMLGGAASAAYLIGNAMSANAGDPPPMALVSDEF